MNEESQPSRGKAGEYSMLFSPFRIRDVELHNRLVFQPHFTALGTLDGQPTDAHVAYHEERARGGVALIIFESQAIHHYGQDVPQIYQCLGPRGHSACCETSRMPSMPTAQRFSAS